MSGKSASILMGGPRKVKPVLPEAATAPPAPKLGQWIRKPPSFDAKLTPAAAAASPPPPLAVPVTVEDPNRLIDAPNDPDYDEDFGPIPTKPLVVCGYCRKRVESVSEQCYQCKRSFCVECQMAYPLSLIIDKAIDQETGKEVQKCFGCTNKESFSKEKKRSIPDDDKSDDIIEEADERAKEIDKLLEPYTTTSKKRNTSEKPYSVSVSSTASIIRILPDPPPGPDLVYKQVDKSFCELPVCLRCVANGISVRNVRTATGVSTMCGHVIYCVGCTVSCLSQKGVMCPYPDCETVIDTIVLIQNSVQKQ
jgi:hypothetical protein